MMVTRIRLTPIATKALPPAKLASTQMGKKLSMSVGYQLQKMYNALLEEQAARS